MSSSASATTPPCSAAARHPARADHRCPGRGRALRPALEFARRGRPPRRGREPQRSGGHGRAAVVAPALAACCPPRCPSPPSKPSSCRRRRARATRAPPSSAATSRARRARSWSTSPPPDRCGRGACCGATPRGPATQLWVTGSIGGGRGGARDAARGHRRRRGRRRALQGPTPRLREAWAMARDRAARAAIDVSDGLADAVRQLATASGVGARLDAATPAARPGARRWFEARGEDPVLAASAPATTTRCSSRCRRGRGPPARGAGRSATPSPASACSPSTGCVLTRDGATRRCPRDSSTSRAPDAAACCWRVEPWLRPYVAAVLFVFVTRERDSTEEIFDANGRPRLGTALRFEATAYCKGETTAAGTACARHGRRRSGVAAAGQRGARADGRSERIAASGPCWTRVPR